MLTTESLILVTNTEIKCSLIYLVLFRYHSSWVGIWSLRTSKLVCLHLWLIQLNYLYLNLFSKFSGILAYFSVCFLHHMTYLSFLLVHFSQTDPWFCCTGTIYEKRATRWDWCRDYQHCLLKKAYQHYDRCSLMAKCSVLWCLHLWLSLDSEVTSYELYFFWLILDSEETPNLSQISHHHT